jgi:hypothetical protein
MGWEELKMNETLWYAIPVIIMSLAFLLYIIADAWRKAKMCVELEKNKPGFCPCCGRPLNDY